MLTTSLVWLIGTCLYSGVVTTQTSGTLPEALRTHLQQDRFGIVTSIRGLPLGVREELQALFRSPDLDIAEPGADFRATGASGAGSSLPSRRLVAAACSADHCIVYYERGGSVRTWHAALFHWTPAATRFEFGGIAPGGLKTIDAVRTAFLSGALKRSLDSW